MSSEWKLDRKGNQPPLSERQTIAQQHGRRPTPPHLERHGEDAGGNLLRLEKLNLERLGGVLDAVVRDLMCPGGGEGLFNQETHMRPQQKDPRKRLPAGNKTRIHKVGKQKKKKNATKHPDLVVAGLGDAIKDARAERRVARVAGAVAGVDRLGLDDTAVADVEVAIGGTGQERVGGGRQQVDGVEVGAVLVALLVSKDGANLC